MPNMSVPMRGADGRADAAGDGGAADDGGGDALELLAEALPDIGHVDVEHVEHGDDDGRHSGEHVKDDLHSGDGHAHLGGRIGIAAGGEDPVSEAGVAEKMCAEQRRADPPVESDGHLEEVADEERVERVAHELGLEAIDLRGAGDEQRDGEAEAAQDEHRPERDQEGRDRQAHGDGAVDGAHQGGEGEASPAAAQSGQPKLTIG